MVRHLQSCKARRMPRSIEGSFWFERMPGVGLESQWRRLSPTSIERAAGRSSSSPARIYDKTPTSTQSRKTASRSSRPAGARLSPAEHKSPQTLAGADHDVRAHPAALPARVAPARARVLHARGEEQVSWVDWEKPAKGVDRRHSVVYWACSAAAFSRSTRLRRFRTYTRPPAPTMTNSIKYNIVITPSLRSKVARGEPTFRK